MGWSPLRKKITRPVIHSPPSRYYSSVTQQNTTPKAPVKVKLTGAITTTPDKSLGVRTDVRAGARMHPTGPSAWGG
jgi:hypothetical protein